MTTYSGPAKFAESGRATRARTRHRGKRTRPGLHLNISDQVIKSLATVLQERKEDPRGVEEPTTVWKEKRSTKQQTSGGALFLFARKCKATMMRCSPMQQRKRPSLCFGSGLLCSPTDAARPAPSRRETRPVKSVTGTHGTILVGISPSHLAVRSCWPLPPSSSSSLLLCPFMLHVFCLATSQARSCAVQCDHCELICGRAM